jgi:hypothetical protein
MNNSLVNAMVMENNKTFTENGALTNKSTTSALLDWFGLGAALRTRSEAEVISLFSKAFAENRLMALKALFYVRDVRGGQGERTTFRTCLRWLANNYPEVVSKNLENVPFYGRWDDLYALDGTGLETLAYELFGDALKSDEFLMEVGKPITLASKWAKSENTSNKESRRLAYKTRKYLGLSSKQYRKLLSKLRKYCNVVETKMCANEWDQIDFGHVPSKASLLYKKSFNKHESARYARFLQAVEEGKAKINAGAVYPYEILRDILNCSGDVTAIKAADLQWKSLPNYLENNPHYGLVIADVSGSMYGLPIQVSVSLAIYFAERNVGPFKDMFLTFSSDSRLQKVIGNNLLEKYNNLIQDGWCGSTNLQSAFDNVLEAAIKHNVPKSEMVTHLYVISDMEFNCACDDNTNYEVAKKKYEAAGYDLPKIVFWNVNARNNQSPVTVDDKGTCLVSGCSPSILKSVLGTNVFDPVSVMNTALNNERYDKVVL